MQQKCSWNGQKQMSNMPSVFDFGFQTNQYSIPQNTFDNFSGYTQPQLDYNNPSMAKLCSRIDQVENKN